eukprot:12506604-Alexandrium_andersonii.AAC.1
MSASLVGSEMCIRDRPLTHTEFAERRNAWGRVQRWGPEYGNAGLVRECCLLYTSDAADDM